jgi:hypothetical protein
MSSADYGIYGILILILIVIIFRIIYYFVIEPDNDLEINQPLLDSNV